MGAMGSSSRMALAVCLPMRRSASANDPDDLYLGRFDDRYASRAKFIWLDGADRVELLLVTPDRI